MSANKTFITINFLLLKVKIKEIYCKSVLSKSGIYGVDYALNPYTGCQHGCIYCYAIFMRRFTNRKEKWGEFVDIKINAPTILSKEIKKFQKDSILISSVTDAYQPLERKYEITRKCLNVLSKYDFPVTFLTKSDLILRDLDLIEQMNSKVGFTFTTIDENIRKIFEPRASSIEKRLDALENIENKYIFFGPILPLFSDTEEKIREAFIKFEEKNVKRLYIDKMNLYPNVWKRMKEFLDRKTVTEYQKIKNSEEYPILLKKRISDILKDFNFEYKIGW
ncbi:radical SAM protein [Thermococci archaeon]|nr:MAG: radical SAM protein [Thermococci archaeon]